MLNRRALLLIPLLVVFFTCTVEEPPPPPPPPDEQGLQPNEEAAATKAIHALLGEDRIAMVVTARKPSGADFTYEVWSDLDRDGDLTHFTFHRVSKADGSYDFTRGPLLGDSAADQDPLADTSNETLATHEEELAASGGSLYIPLEAASYPFALERISAAFDHKDAGDLMVVYTPSGKGKGGGSHGNLSMAASRSPLLISGAGIASTGYTKAPARLIDIAPTLAKLLGVKTTTGKRLDGSLGKTYLKRQDGRVLDEIMTSTPTAKRAVVLVLDGASHTRLRKLLEDGKLPNMAKLTAAGAFFEFGAIGNFPANTFPGHNSIGTGCYSGHHGLLDNHYYDRVAHADQHPYDQLVSTSEYLEDDIETLFEALNRSYDKPYTVSLNDPCARGATFATLDLKLPGGIPKSDAACADLPTLIGLSPKGGAAYLGHVLAMQIAMKELLGSKDPKLMLLNMPVLDVMGHEKGPHDPSLEPAYIATDKLIGCLLDTLAKAGKLDSTVIVVTSDHGMASQSPTTSGGIYRALPKAGVSYTSPGNLFIYLKCLDLRTSVKHLKGGSTTKLVVTVSDDDHDKTGKRPPSIGATVTVHVDGKVVTGVTNFLGKATLYIKPTKGTKSVSILASHGGFNEAAKTLPVK